MAEIKRITLHPLTEEGKINPKINLYPKTLSTAIVDEHGEPVSFATTADLSNLETHIGEELLLKADKSEIPTNYVTTDTYQNITGQKTFRHIKEFTISELANERVTWHIYDGGVSGDTGKGELLLDWANHSSPYEYKNLLRLSHNRTDIMTDLYINDIKAATTEDCGTKLYKHVITTTASGLSSYTFVIISKSNTSITTQSALISSILSEDTVNAYANKQETGYTISNIKLTSKWGAGTGDDINGIYSDGSTVSALSIIAASTTYPGDYTDTVTEL